MFKYKDLTPEQKKHICNGCGGKGGVVKPPNFIFKASCNHHDFLFWIGFSIKHFLIANTKFYKWMRVDIKESKVRWYKKTYYHTWAFTYYMFVNAAGVKFFHFSDTKKTLSDLNEEIADAKTKKMLDAIKKDNKELL